MQEPSPMSEIMPKSLKLLGEDFYIKYLRNSVIYHWKDIVGKANADVMLKGRSAAPGDGFI